MNIDFQQLIENQIKIVAKAQNMTLIELTEKNTELVQTHANLLFELCEFDIVEDDDEGEDDVINKPTPQPGNSKSY